VTQGQARAVVTYGNEVGVGGPQRHSDRSGASWEGDEPVHEAVHHIEQRWRGEVLNPEGVRVLGHRTPPSFSTGMRRPLIS
jgi:hypothetical protein